MPFKVAINHPHSLPVKRFLSRDTTPLFARMQVSFMQMNLKLENLQIIGAQCISCIMLMVL